MQKKLNRRLIMSDTGFVYALKNSSFGDGIYKIGMTEKDPQERTKELSSQTSIPSPFEIVAAIKVVKLKMAEKFIHERLVDYRVNGKKEFFKIEIEGLKTAMNETAYNFRPPIIEDIEDQYRKANDDLRQFISSFEQLDNFFDYDSYYEYQSEEFRNTFDKYETWSISFTEQLAAKIRSQAQIEKKRVDSFITDIVVDKLNKDKT